MLCSFVKQRFPKADRGKTKDSDNGFYICEYECEDSKKDCQLAVDENGNDLNGYIFCAKGQEIPRLSACLYDIQGHWETKNGYRTFVIESYTESVKKDKRSVIEFLKARLPHVGEKTANEMWDKWGAEVLDILEKDPMRLSELKRFTPKKLEEVVTAYNEKKGLQEVFMTCIPLGIKKGIAEKIYDKYKNQSVDIINHHPYKLCRKFKGISFEMADQMAINNNVPYDSNERISAGILEILYQAEYGGKSFSRTTGHLAVEINELVDKTAELLKYEVNNYRISMVLDDMERTRQIVKNNDIFYPGRILVSTRYVSNVETELAISIARIARVGVNNLFDIERAVKDKELKENVGLAPEQRAAVKLGLSYSFGVITGGPGTGKTTILKFIRDIYQEQNPGKKILLCSPTGVAATRMTESTGAEACTVHKALGLAPSDDDDNYYQDVEILDYDMVVVDETSMLDVYVAKVLCKAIDTGAKLLFIGDIDQLPSVGPGAVLRDIIESGCIPVARLTKVYRQKSDNCIAINANLVKHGRSCFELNTNEFEVYETYDFSQARTMMTDIYMREVSANGISNVMMLSPFKNKTDTCVHSLNELRDQINPPSPNKKEFKVGLRYYREGDKVMNLKNSEVVSNGEIGMITRFFKKKVSEEEDAEKKMVMEVDFGHDKVTYTDEEAMERIDWAYAMTVHKSQGSEAKVVILNLMDGHGIMLKRNLLYTAITRAKQKVYIIGSWSAIRKSVVSGVSIEDRRNTLLAQKLRYLMSLDDSKFSQLLKRFG